MARTKIVATIGPASSSPDILREMIREGMNVARINFSHGSHESLSATVATIRKIADEENRVVAILGDLQGPKIRLGQLPDGGIQLTQGDTITLTPKADKKGKIHVPHPEVLDALAPGSRIVIGDGELEFEVVGRKGEDVRCSVTYDGLLESRKGINTPGTLLPISSITDKDQEDLGLICSMSLDFVALSFVRAAKDVNELRELMRMHNTSIPVIAKIEKSEAVAALDEIISVADGIMVARGDLGLDVPPQEVPLLQKDIIRRCNDAGKPVITATQMLQSMVDLPRPTRAEASDVANAILDGTDAIMLSGETAAGKYPVASVTMMRHIGEITEKQFPFDRWLQKRQESFISGDVTSAISRSCCTVAEQIDAKYIISTTMSGYTATKIARHRPITPVVAVTPVPATRRRLALVWGVECLMIPPHKKSHKMIENTTKAIESLNLQPGDKIVITAGVPLGKTGQTNLIQVHEINPLDATDKAPNTW